MKKGRIVSLVALFLVLILLSSCGGGGAGSNDGSSNAGVNAAGIWEGVIYSNTTRQSYKVVGIVSETGILRFLNIDALTQFSGVVSGSNNHISTTVTGYAPYGATFLDGSTITTFNIEGTVEPRKTINLTYSGGGENGTITLTYDIIYERNSAISLLQGRWNSLMSGDTLTIDQNGSISGTFDYFMPGCVYSGKVSIINADYNAYQISVTFSNCDGLNGTLTGLLTLGDYIGTNDYLIFGVSNAQSSVVLDFYR